jgi:flagellar P-ring protein precursor FlgI
VVTPRSEIEVSEERSPMFLFGPAVTLAQVVEAVNRVGAGPSDLVAILEALREAGALRAELVVI